ncbi:PREDICTED: uncharacterized protein LOC108574862 [Habropoda laboriosa]|uniref:uncharacterized protein LOC108574862 n=1 Tax=Habropoda laboriosa TaxID=597456 RepID=UPI00083D8CAC|nr:PREDICTED: uncharacterized protein LOC108574862 [Habropoda laboriosa]
MDVAEVAEPHWVPINDPGWIGDPGGSVAIAARRQPRSPSIRALGAGRGFVAVEWGDFAAVAVYAPHSWTLAEYEEYLDGLRDLVSRIAHRPVLVQVQRLKARGNKAAGSDGVPDRALVLALSVLGERGDGWFS